MTVQHMDAPPELPPEPTILCVQLEVCHEQLISLAEMLSHRKRRSLVAARHEAICRVWRETTKTTGQIARAFNRDPSTIWDVINRMLEDD